MIETKRRATNLVKGRRVLFGASAPVTIQSMLKVPTADPQAVIENILTLVNITPDRVSDRDRQLLKQLRVWQEFVKLPPVSCEIIRLGIPDSSAIAPLKAITSCSPIPVVADIHFDARLALAAVEAGVDKIRINPGNITDEGLLKELAGECIRQQVPIRIGVNAGSLDKATRLEFREDIVSGAVASALRSTALMESFGCRDLVISVKTNTAAETVEAYEKLADQTDYPLHLGVTEAGVGVPAIVQSWTGIGCLLSRGIGDTVRISLTESPMLEVICGALLLTDYHFH